MPGPVQKLLVEQDAVDMLHCGSTQKNGCLDQNMAMSAVLIIVLHTSSVLVTVRATKKMPKLFKTGKSLRIFFRNSGVFCEVLVIC